MKIFIWLAVAVAVFQARANEIPQAVLPEGVGINIHFTTGHERDLDLITAAGFKFVRMDFDWQSTETKPGHYDWKAWDELTANLRKHGLGAIYILDYTHSAYEPMVEGKHATGKPTPYQHTASARHPKSIEAFARWAAASAKHFHGERIIWEIYNEPNGNFWVPEPNADEYTAMALPTAKAIREAEPDATIVAPAMAGFNWKFIEVVLKSGILQYLDAVTVHPYRNVKHGPETAGKDYATLRGMINQYAPPQKKGGIPILCGEWGYPTSSVKGISTNMQSDFAVRQQLFNLWSGIPLTIWYDWKNDGTNSSDPEQNFGTVTDNLDPKPAYEALQKMTGELAGYRLVERLNPQGTNGQDFILLFGDQAGTLKIAAWTTGSSHETKISKPDLWPLPIKLEQAPQYVTLRNGLPK